MASDVLVEQGGAALAACDWATARSCFDAAVASEETAEAVDGLGQALYWQGEYARALALRERAYTLFRRRGDQRPAALTAVQLAMLHWLIHGDGAAVSGWVGHARRMLDGDHDCVEAGWVELFLASSASDPEECERRARTALELGRHFGEPGLEFDALGHLGMSFVQRGAVGYGMGLIDETVAAVTSGVVADPWATAEILCTLFHACELAVDVRRAEQWLGMVDRHVERTGELPVFGICRMHYGGLLTAVGRWADAERELLSAIDVYEVGYRGTRFEPLLRLADLRARQGRLEEAERLIDGYEELPGAAVPRARLYLARGEPRMAAAVVERHLARRGRGVLSAPALALLVEAELAAGKTTEAGDLAAELAALDRVSGQPSLRGLAALSRARVAVAAGADTAVALFEQAMAAFAESESPGELARTRLELAATLAGDEPEVARAEARAALDCFQELEATAHADAAASLLRQLGDRRRALPRSSATLTRRETEVLRLLAEGLTNAAIAERLFVSPRTAEHHVSNILSKLRLGSRTEAAAYAIRTLASNGPADA